MNGNNYQYTYLGSSFISSLSSYSKYWQPCQYCQYSFPCTPSNTPQMVMLLQPVFISLWCKIRILWTIWTFPTHFGPFHSCLKTENNQSWQLWLTFSLSCELHPIHICQLLGSLKVVQFIIFLKKCVKNCAFNISLYINPL